MHDIGYIPRPAWLEINLPNITHNVRQIRRLLKPETELMAVVKANAYGDVYKRQPFYLLIWLG